MSEEEKKKEREMAQRIAEKILSLRRDALRKKIELLKAELESIEAMTAEILVEETLKVKAEEQKVKEV